MSGVTIIGALLEAHEPVTAVVPSERIKGGRLPDDTPLPALLVRSVSTVERHMLRRGSLVRTIERVSVTVRAASYQQQDDILLLVTRTCAGKGGAIAGFERVSVLTAGTGPDVNGPGDSYEKTQDFRVSFDAPA